MNYFLRLFATFFIVLFSTSLFASNNNGNQQIDCPSTTIISNIKFESAMQIGSAWLLSQHFDYKNRDWALQYVVRINDANQQNIISKAQALFNTIPLSIIFSAGNNNKGLCVYAQKDNNNNKNNGGYSIFAMYGFDGNPNNYLNSPIN